MQSFLQQSGIFLNQLILDEPGAIVGPISVVLGAIINFIYNAWSFITPVGALGVSIIIMTIIVRMALLPTSFKMVSNSMKMRDMKPEMDKIKEKYGNTKDPELRRKMQAEIQALNSKHGVNMLASCLPMLITWPLFLGLFSVLNQAFLFVGNVGDAYTVLSQALIDLGPDFLRNSGIAEIAAQRTPAGMLVNLDDVSFMNKLIHVLSPADWGVIFAQVPANELANIQNLFNQKESILTFLTLNLVAQAGTAWPGILLPILSAGTMLLSQYLMTKTNPAMDEQSKNMQKVMMFIFPIMFGFFTIQAPAGVGLYWVMLNVVMTVQHYFITKYYTKKNENNKNSNAGAKA